VRVTVALRLGVDLINPHNCPCDQLVDAHGSHGLSCRLAFGRMARRRQLNDTIWYALSRADIPSIKEPSGLLRSDGKRPDVLTLIPWVCGKPLTWDVTVIDTVADSYILLSSVTCELELQSTELRGNP
jgi:hypothetical protein